MSLLDPAVASPDFKWDEVKARHLLNRAGFGVPPQAVAKLVTLKPDQAIDAFVNYEKFPDSMPAPGWLPEVEDYRRMRQLSSSLSEDEKRMLRTEAQRDERETMSRLQMWWLDRMCHTQRPLEEKMTLFWHGHFATSAEKVKEPVYNYGLNEIFRRNAAGNFKKLTLAVGKSPAMLRYLDQTQSSKQHPNENWARELMELFTLGIGHYTEQDIKEGARAFTGWITGPQGQFIFARPRHDDGSKTFLGQTGNFDGDKIVDIIFEQPACAEWICKKLWKFFAYDDPEETVVKDLADTLRKNNYEVKPVLTRIFSSQAFYSDKAINTMIKPPAQLIVNLLVQLDAPLPEKPPIAQLAMRAMGQTLFYPPNVKGWDGGRAWINTNTLLVRYNFANYLVSGVVPDFGDGRKIPGAKQVANDEMKSQSAPANGKIMMMAEDNSMQGDKDNMMAGSQGSNRDAPAGQDSEPKDVANRSLVEAMKQRRKEAGALETRQMAQAPFRVRDFFSRYEGMTSQEIVDALSAYFVGFPLKDEQKEKLLAVLAQGVKPGQPVPVMKMAEEDLRATAQLLLSTVEYQVC